MTARSMILKVARLFEKQPLAYNFLKTQYPRNLKDTGCIIGWVGYFLGLKADKDGVGRGLAYAAKKGLGVEDWEVYQRMDTVDEGRDALRLPSKTWENSAIVCAATLRRYANKYHPLKRKRA